MNEEPLPDKHVAHFEGWFSVSLLCGFALATVPQVILDPLLVTHVRFSSRHYPYAWWLIPIAGFLFIGVWRLIRSSHRRLTLLSFAAALAAAIPIFYPEVPHMNLVASGVLWLMIAAVWQWLHDTLAPQSLLDKLRGDRETLRYYIKEEAAFCVKLLLGGIAALLGIVVTALLGMHTANELIVSGESDRFLLNIYSNFQMTVVAAYWILGPMREILVKRASLLNALA